MWTARRGRPSRRAAAGGFTILEIAVSLVVFSMMALLVERTLAVTHSSEQYLDAVRRTTERGQSLAYQVFDTLSSSRKLFGRDVEGLGYLEAIDLIDYEPLPDARLPLVDANGILDPDLPGDPRTGNVLLFVRESDPAPCVADPALGKVRFIDTYRFICVYPSESVREVVSGTGPARDLVVWRSLVYPSHPQILAIEDPVERENVVRDLYDRFRYDRAWDPNGDVDSSFYPLQPSGLVEPAPYVAPTIEEDVTISEGGRLVYANLQLARTSAASYPRRAVFTVDDAADWQPDGFEVKIVGPSGARKVWMNLVVEGQATRDRQAVHTSTLITSVRDL